MVSMGHARKSFRCVKAQSFSSSTESFDLTIDLVLGTSRVFFLTLLVSSQGSFRWQQGNNAIMGSDEILTDTDTDIRPGVVIPNLKSPVALAHIHKR